MGSRSLPVDGVVMSRRLLNEGDAKIREPPELFSSAGAPQDKRIHRSSRERALETLAFKDVLVRRFQPN
jgi:hypothetical protein